MTHDNPTLPANFRPRRQPVGGDMPRPSGMTMVVKDV